MYEIIILKKMQFEIFIPLIIKSALYKIICNSIKIPLKIQAPLYLPIKKKSHASMQRENFYFNCDYYFDVHRYFSA